MKKSKPTFDLDTPLCHFSSVNGSTPFTIRHSVEGLSIMGITGSGKTSGSGRFFALKYLSAGYGFLVLTVKEDEADFWRSLCRETGRQKDLIIVEPESKYFFNFLDYEASRDKGSYTQNIVKLLKTVIQSSEEKNGGKSNDPFWDKSLDLLLWNVCELCLLAYGKLSIQQLYDIVNAAPSKEKGQQKTDASNPFASAFETASNLVRAKVDAYRTSLSVDELKAIRDPDAYERKILSNVPDARRLKAVDQFFIDTYRTLAEKTRSIVQLSFSSFLHGLLQDPIYSLFCRHESTYSPEDCLKGRIVVINLPIKIHGDIGRDVQCLVKKVFQQAFERRDVKKNPRPVAIWADECQHFMLEDDALFQATARSSRIAVVNLTQNLSSYYANMGGDSHRMEHKVKSLLGNFGTKVFHANSCQDTNFYASSLIGQAYIEDISRSSTVSGDFSATRNAAYKLEPMVRPEMFGLLKTGGPKNQNQVEAYIHCQGRRFDNGMNFKKVTFLQQQTEEPGLEETYSITKRLREARLKKDNSSDSQQSIF